MILKREFKYSTTCVWKTGFLIFCWILLCVILIFGVASEFNKQHDPHKVSINNGQCTNVKSEKNQFYDRMLLIYDKLFVVFV